MLHSYSSHHKISYHHVWLFCYHYTYINDALGTLAEEVWYGPKGVHDPH